MRTKYLIYAVLFLLVMNLCMAQPVWETSSPYEATILEDELFTMYLNVTEDEMNFPVTFETTANDDEIGFDCFAMQKINDTQLLVNFTPDNEHTGYYEFFIVAENNYEESTNLKMKINVTNVNDDPIINETSPEQEFSVHEDGSRLLYATVSDDDLITPEGDNITYTWLLDGVNSTKLNWTKVNDTYSYANYKPDMDDFDAGYHNITLIVNDSYGQQDKYTWNATVINVNRPPEFNGTIANITWPEDNNLTDNLTLRDFFSDPDANGTMQEIDTGNNLTFGYSIVNASGDAIDAESNIDIPINNSNVSFYPDKDWNGNMTIRFYMNDSNPKDNIAYSNIVTLTVLPVNDPPVISPISDTYMYAYTSYDLQVRATDVDNDTLQYHLDTDLNASINSSGYFETYAEAGDTGTHIVNITVSDGTVNVSEIFEIEVHPNNRPYIIPFENKSAAQYDLLSIIVNGTDADGETLTFSSNSTLLEGIRYNATSWNFTTDISSQLDVGNHTIRLYVNDTHDASSYYDFTLEVTDTKLPPVIYNISFPNDQVKVNAVLDQEILAWDEDEDIVSFHDNTTMFNINTLDTGDFFTNATGQILFTPSVVGYNEINISVTDQMGYEDSFILRMNITPNSIPEWTYYENITCPEDSVCSSDFEAEDYDWQDTLRYGEDTTLFDINSSNGNIEFLPTYQGFYNVTYWVSDGTENITVDLYVNITQVNDPPYYTTNVSNMSIWDTVTEGHRTYFNLTAKDEENDTITIDVEFINFTNLANVTTYDVSLFNYTNITTVNESVTGTIDFRPGTTDPGLYWVNISASDPYSSSSHVFAFEVRNINNPPEVNWTLVYDNETVKSDLTNYEFNATENTTVYVNTSVFDIDYDTWNYTWMLEYFNRTEVIGNESWINYTLPFLTAPESTLILNVTDEGNASTIIRWTMDVENINRPCYFGRYTYLFEEHDGQLNQMEIVEGNLQLEEISPGLYVDGGDYISEVIHFNFRSIDWFQVLNLTRLSMNHLNGEYGFNLTTYTSTSANEDTAISNMISTQDGMINSQSEEYMSFWINVTEAGRTPIIRDAEIVYEIANVDQVIGNRDSDYPGWLVLDDFFKDPDLDDKITYNYTILEGSSFVQLNITNRDQVDLQLIDEGVARVRFFADDNQGSTAQSNIITIKVEQEEERQQTSSSSGGVQIQKEIEYRDVEVPVSLSIIHPKNITVFNNDTIEIPIELQNNNKFDFSEISLWLESESEDISLKLDKYQIDELRKGETREVMLTAEIDEIKKAYSVYVTVNITDPEYVDTAKILISPLKRSSYDNESVNLKFAFVKDLLQKNSECSELSEYISRAQASMKQGDYGDASLLLEEFVNDCKVLMKESKNIDQPAEVSLSRRIGQKFFEDEELFVVGFSILVITVFTVIVAIFMYRKV